MLKNEETTKTKEVLAALKKWLDATTDDPDTTDDGYIKIDVNGLRDILDKALEIKFQHCSYGDDIRIRYALADTQENELYYEYIPARLDTEAPVEEWTKTIDRYQWVIEGLSSKANELSRRVRIYTEELKNKVEKEKRDEQASVALTDCIVARDFDRATEIITSARYNAEPEDRVLTPQFDALLKLMPVTFPEEYERNLAQTNEILASVSAFDFEEPTYSKSVRETLDALRIPFGNAFSKDATYAGHYRRCTEEATTLRRARMRARR